MLRASVLAFLPALVLLAVASTTLAQPDLIHRQTLQSRDVPGPDDRSELVRTRSTLAASSRATPTRGWRSAMSRTGRRSCGCRANPTAP